MKNPTSCNEAARHRRRRTANISVDSTGTKHRTVNRAIDNAMISSTSISLFPPSFLALISIFSPTLNSSTASSSPVAFAVAKRTELQIGH